jgi:putative endonuclease
VKTKQYSVYIVVCSDFTLYTGISNDVNKRIESHNLGKGAKYTKTRRPVRLVYEKKCGCKSDALKLEYKTKQLSRTEKIKLCQEYLLTDVLM